MDSDQKEKPRQQFNVEENRAHKTQGPRNKFTDSAVHSFTKDEVQNGEVIGKFLVPKSGKIADVSVFVEELNMNDAKIELDVKPANLQKSDRIYRVSITEGFTELDDIEVNKGDRLVISLKDLQETIIKGIWIAFSYKQGG